MSEKELSQFYWLRQEIKKIEEQIARFGDGVGAIKFEEHIKSSSPKIQSIQEKRAELLSDLLDARITALEKYIEIESYIEKVEDSEIRQIMRHRFLDLMDWYEIGQEMNCDRTTASKKMRTYIKEHLVKVSHNSQ